MSRWLRATALVLVSAGVATPAAAQPLPPAEPASHREPPPSVLGAPIAVKGEPIERVSESSFERDSSLLPPTVTPVGASFPEPRPGRAATLAAPTSTSAVPAGAVEQPPRTTPSGSPADPVNDLLARRSTYRKEPPPGHDDRAARKFGDHLDGVLGQREEWFRSDHAFDGFISPITNPFLFEDPRSLTEVRPIYMYQRMPGSQPEFSGGNISYFGMQGRVAITNRLSFVVHKLGGLWINPGDGATFSGKSGFAELWLGPKFTFIRSEETCSLLAGGLQFQVPVGSAGVFQDTGNLSIVPYATYGQNFFRNSPFGSFNGLLGGGYAFSTSSARSDYLFLSAHLDMDVVNWHRIYPVAELNYFLYTTNGTNPLIGVEGRDLINFGGQAKGNNMLSGALGARFKITEAAQFGAAFEAPLVGNKDLMQYRFTLDLILRY
jgi:hypothetical protein